MNAIVCGLVQPEMSHCRVDGTELGLRSALCDAQRMNPADFSGSITFPLMPETGSDVCFLVVCLQNYCSDIEFRHPRSQQGEF